MIEILRPGPLATVQDLGRPGYRRYGVGWCGALDGLALTLANRLVGNPDAAAGLEITLGPAQLRFHAPAHIALAGADCAATLDGAVIPRGWSVPVKAGQTLQLQVPSTGMRAYLAVAGGIAVTPAMASRSTDLNAGFGGWQGRALRSGDYLPLGTPQRPPARRGLRLPPITPCVRALPGPEYGDFSAASQAGFWQSAWQIGAQSNRMGYRLQSAAALIGDTPELRSHAVLPGVVQVPPNGQPILLMADAQTTGGYPKIATVIETDLWMLAQLRPGSTLRFAPCTLEAALAARRKLRRYLEYVEKSLYAQH